MKNLKFLLTFVLFVALSATSFARTPKYVFFIIGDGMGISQVYATEYYMGQVGLGELNFKHFPVVTMVTTHSASSLVTDSAASGTALATGRKTKNGMLGVLPDSTAVVSLSEKAKAKGLGAAVVTSDALVQATPAAFSIHCPSRKNTDDIALQLINSNIDFMAGSTIYGKNTSTAELIRMAREKGIEVFCGEKAYSPVKGKRVMYLSENPEETVLPYTMDNKDGKRSLKDFTAAAIDYMYSNYRKGFFMMIEGAHTDGAGHSKDAASTINEVLNLSRSVDIVLDFYNKHPEETLIIVTSDHETGACTIRGSKLNLLENQDGSITALTDSLTLLAADGKEVTWSAVKNLLRKQMGFWDDIPVSKEEEKVLTALYKEAFLDFESDKEADLYHTNRKLAVEAVRYIESVSGLNFYSSSHTGTPVGLYVKGAKASEFMSCRDNTDIPATVSRVAGY